MLIGARCGADQPDHRRSDSANGTRAVVDFDDLDPVSQDLLIGQTAVLEKYHWFVRSHLENWAGGMSNAGAGSELDAARAVAAKSHNAVGSRTGRRADRGGGEGAAGGRTGSVGEG